MRLNVLSLNCQKNYNKNLSPFLIEFLREDRYDLYLLQEATNEALMPFKAFKDYKIVNTKDERGRLSLPCIVYNSKRGKLKDFFYQPILFDSIERQESKKPFQSFGIARAIFTFRGLEIAAGNIHLPSGFSGRRRLQELTLAKKVMGEAKDADISFFGGDCNFCLSSEIRKASNIVAPEYVCLTSKLGSTLDSYYTECNLPYSWIHVNDFLRKIGLRVRLKTDHLFVDKETSKNRIKTRILPNRVSDHSPIEMVIVI